MSRRMFIFRHLPCDGGDAGRSSGECNDNEWCGKREDWNFINHARQQGSKAAACQAARQQDCFMPGSKAARLLHPLGMYDNRDRAVRWRRASSHDRSRDLASAGGHPTMNGGNDPMPPSPTASPLNGSRHLRHPHPEIIIPSIPSFRRHNAVRMVSPLLDPVRWFSKIQTRINATKLANMRDQP